MKFAAYLPAFSAVLVVAGCTYPAGRAPQAYPAVQQQAMEQYLPPEQQLSTASLQNSTMQALHSQVMSEMNSLRERVLRVERAMIRLDRRMQLVEQNELSRMQGVPGSVMAPGGDASGQMQGGASFRPMAFDGATTQQPARQMPVQGQTYPAAPQQMQQGWMQVSAAANDGMITSSLQAAPASTAAKSSGAAAAQRSFSGLPSLADNPDAQQNADDTSVAIWTIEYDNSKIWPSRDQLTGSREVVEALRSDKPVALFARGARPSSKEFRERVRALSRYLGRVANKESIPIASLPAEHLTADTIEILATK